MWAYMSRSWSMPSIRDDEGKRDALWWIKHVSLTQQTSYATSYIKTIYWCFEF